jgi:hypothetical protein
MTQPISPKAGRFGNSLRRSENPRSISKKKYVVFVSELRNKSKKVEHSVSLFRCINRHLIYHAKYPHPNIQSKESEPLIKITSAIVAIF